MESIEIDSKTEEKQESHVKFVIFALLAGICFGSWNFLYNFCARDRGFHMIFPTWISNFLFCVPYYYKLGR